MPEVSRAVIISGFAGIAEEMIGFVRFPFPANIIRRYEKKPDPRFGTLDNRAYFADKPIGRMTAQDPAVYEEILRLIGD